jgi:hypothetical protein
VRGKQLERAGAIIRLPNPQYIAHFTGPEAGPSARDQKLFRSGTVSFEVKTSR